MQMNQFYKSIADEVRQARGCRIVGRTHNLACPKRSAAGCSRCGQEMAQGPQQLSAQAACNEIKPKHWTKSLRSIVTPLHDGDAADPLSVLRYIDC